MLALVALITACSPSPQPAPEPDVGARGPLRLLVAVGFDPEGRDVGAEELLPEFKRVFRTVTDTPWDVVLLSGEEASEQEIRTTLEREVSNRRRVPHPDDQVVLWIIAHGGAPEDGSEDIGVLLAASSGEGSYGVPAARLLGLVEDLPVARSVLVLDVCFAAGGTPSGGTTPGAYLEGRRRTQVFTGAGPAAPAYTVPGEGPFYSTCFLEALEDGLGGLNATQAQLISDARAVSDALALTRDRTEDAASAVDQLGTCWAGKHGKLIGEQPRVAVQRPQLFPGGAYEIPFRADLSGDPLVVMDGASRWFDAPAELWIAGAFVAEGRALLGAPDGARAFDCSGGCGVSSAETTLRFAGEVLKGPERRRIAPGHPLLIAAGTGLSLGTGVPDWSWVQVEADTRSDDATGASGVRFEEVASETGLLELIDGLPTRVTPITFVSEGETFDLLIVTRRESPPVLARAITGPGGRLRFEDVSARFGADSLPGDGGVGAFSAVYDLDQDGAPEFCGLDGRAHRMICLDADGPTALAPLGLAGEVRALPVQADFDGDGDLDLVIHTGRGWTTLLWEGARYAQGPDVVAGGGQMPQQPSLVQIDAFGGPDLLFLSGAGYRLYDNRLWHTGVWSDIPMGLLGLPTRHRLRVLDVFPNGDLDLAILADDGESFEGGIQVLEAADRGELFTPSEAPFELRVEHAVPGQPPDREVYDLAGGDLDRDGLTDLILVHRGWHQPPHRVFLQRPGGAASWERLEGIPGLEMSTDDVQVLIHDIDGDSLPDMLALNGNEAPNHPPAGCCRLFMNRMEGAAPSLFVDVPGREVFAGTEIVVSSAGTLRRARLDGGRRTSAAAVALPDGEPPDWVRLRWPDGRTTTVEDRDRFIPDPRGGFRLVATREEMARPNLLVGPYRVDLRAAQQRAAPVLVEALAGVSDFHWALQLEPDLLAVHGRLPDGEDQLWWLDGSGGILADPVPSTGCAWASPQPSQRRIVAGCESSSGKWLGVLAYRGAAWTTSSFEERQILGYPRKLVELGGSAWLSSGRRFVTRRDATTLAPLRPPEDSTADCGAGRSTLGCGLEGGLDREFMHVDGERLLVLDAVGGRVEVWDVSDPDSPVLRGAVPVRSPTGSPAWDEYRGWWWIPVRGGFEAVDPDLLGLPVRREVWDKSTLALLPVGPDEVATLWAHEGQLYLEVINHRTWAGEGPLVAFPTSFNATGMLRLDRD